MPHGSDVVLHLGGFAVLTFVLVVTLRIHGVRAAARLVAIAIVMPLYAGFDELTQSLVNRSPAWSDWLADIAGAGLIALVEILRSLRAGARTPPRT